MSFAVVFAVTSSKRWFDYVVTTAHVAYSLASCIWITQENQHLTVVYLYNELSCFISFKRAVQVRMPWSAEDGWISSWKLVLFFFISLVFLWRCTFTNLSSTMLIFLNLGFSTRSQVSALKKAKGQKEEHTHTHWHRCVCMFLCVCVHSSLCPWPSLVLNTLKYDKPTSPHHHTRLSQVFVPCMFFCEAAL